jgi:tripartite-type tricarboxylate transporter receptor subunit TctC
MASALNDAEIKQKISALGIDPLGNTPEEFGVFMKAETAKWARVIKQANIVVQ